MDDAGFQDASLILVAHGSTRNARSSESACQQADALRRRGIFAEVLEAFVQQEPLLTGILTRVRTPRVFVVPFFIAEGWFTEHIVPAQLGLRAEDAPDFARVQQQGPTTIYYCQPVGSHPAMHDVLRARAADIVRRYPFPRSPRPSEVALLIAGHGTTYSPGSRASVSREVEQFRKEGEYAEVHAVFLEEPPFVREAWELTAANNLILVPFFLSHGLHTLEDIPIMLGEAEDTVRKRLADRRPPWRNPTERKGKRLWYAEPIGTEPLMADVILQCVRAAVGKKVEAGR